MLQSKTYFGKDNQEYMYTSTDHPFHQIISKYYMTYKYLIKQWNESLFTPVELLNDIIFKIGNDHHCNGLVIEYSLSSVLKISTINWKYYQKFSNAVKNFKNPNLFKFYIVYFRHQIKDIINILKINEDSKQLIIETFQKNKRLKAANSNNRQNLQFGCTIVINGNLVNHLDRDYLQFLLDHEINHYFDKFQFNDKEIPPILTLNDMVRKIALKAGYNLKSNIQAEDFSTHILDNGEFLEMCGDVVNALKIYLKKDEKFQWYIDKCTAKFLSSNKYNQLNIQLRNAILFGAIIRVHSSKHWKLLLKHLKTELKINQSFANKSSNAIKTFFERIKSKFI